MILPNPATLLKVSYGTQAKYNALASKENGTFYVLTDNHKMFVKLPDFDPFELNAATAATANAVVQNLTFTTTANGGDSAGTYNGSTSSLVKTVGCNTIGALPYDKGIYGIAFNNE